MSNFIYEIYKSIKTPEFKEGDEIISQYEDMSTTIFNILPWSINNRYNKSRIAIIPFKLDKSLKLEKEQVKILCKEIENQIATTENSTRKNFLLLCLEFIKTYNSACNKSFRLWVKIKDIEFIPKTIYHLETLVTAINKP